MIVESPHAGLDAGLDDDSRVGSRISRLAESDRKRFVHRHG